ncbi:MAG: NAD-dependent epimerase/dehydratase family protein [Erysipelotrichia bacterium]|nr:NAD-dependent epimerase/dehydratase family protein [Erysipelotrichia bacterium]NCC54039.1 NAD-dependent epimerase/dehydratase family protein [Erysipelotrichia bacterium]
MLKIAITGANGYIASLIQKMNQNKFTFIPLTRKELSLDDPAKVKAFFETLDFDVVLHTAADATTAHCEEQPELTHKINTESSIAIADVCKARNKRLIFFGSEQSFNGKTTSGPFKEEDELVAVTNYGKQKAEADIYIQEHLTDYIILRLSWMMGMAEPKVKISPNIIKNVMNALFNEKPTLFTVNEVRGMTYAKHLAMQFDKIIQLESGVYHFSNVNTLNTYESAKLVAHKLGVSEERIAKYILANHERYADRFRDYRLDNHKIVSQGIKLQTFEENVEECLKDYGWM